jgi:glycine/D-amino acid oxidase-like deaminating enzyme
MRPELKEALDGSKDMPMWLDRPDRPEKAPALSGTVDCTLAIVGAGYTGLWAAICAKEAQPDLDVVLVEASTVGIGASGRNGGFVSDTVTHYQNDRELNLPENGDPSMETLGFENARGFLDTLERYNMNVDYECNGYLHMAVEPHQVTALEALHEADQKSGAKSVMLTKAEVQEQIHSPVFLAGHWTKEGRMGILHPGKLVDGLREAACGLGVRLYENTRLKTLTSEGDDIVLRSAEGEIRSKKVFLATNCFPSLMPKNRGPFIAPVWEYALATEPLSDEQMASIGWEARQGLSGVENFFHYYRLTSDNRIMIGGGAPDYYLNDPQPFAGQSDLARFESIASYFFTVFPQLAGLKFSHRWSGPVGVSRDHAMHFGKAHEGRVVWAQGYSGQGVTPSRFGARVSLALLDIAETELSELAFVKRSPSNWPPSLFRWIGSHITFGALSRQDNNQGKEGLWLKILEKTGFGIHM